MYSLIKGDQRDAFVGPLIRFQLVGQLPEDTELVFDSTGIRFKAFCATLLFWVRPSGQFGKVFPKFILEVNVIQVTC